MIKFYKNTEENLDTLIIPNFFLYELRCKCGKCGLTVLDSDFLYCLQRIRDEYGFSIVPNSVYRCQAYNRKIGGSIYSYHSRGMAIDIPLPENKERREKLIRLARKIFPTTHIYEDKNFIHCDVGTSRKW